jgi:hypothetical protein
VVAAEVLETLGHLDRVTNAIADGPSSIGSSVSTPASRAAILVKVFLTTA